MFYVFFCVESNDTDLMAYQRQIGQMSQQEEKQSGSVTSSDDSESDSTDETCVKRRYLIV